MKKTKNVTTAQLFNIKPLFEMLLEKDYYLCIESQPRINIFGVDPARFALFYAPNIKEILTKVDLHTDLNIFLQEQVLGSKSTIHDVMQYVIDNHLDTKGTITKSWNAHKEWNSHMEDIMYQIDSDDYYVVDSEPSDSMYESTTITSFANLYWMLTDVSFPYCIDKQQKILNEVTRFITNELVPIINKFEITMTEFEPLAKRAEKYIAEMFLLSSL